MIIYGIRQRYIQVTEHFRLLREKVELVRKQISGRELGEAIELITSQFYSLATNCVSIELLKQIEELVFRRGVHPYRIAEQFNEFDLSAFYRRFVSSHLNRNDTNGIQLNLYLKLIQIFMI